MAILEPVTTRQRSRCLFVLAVARCSIQLAVLAVQCVCLASYEFAKIRCPNLEKHKLAGLSRAIAIH